jgi:tRNA (cytidine56-2'-O)-methyltransferase
MKKVFVLRLSHRIKRDVRVTMHCALAARALGAGGMYYCGEKDPALEQRMQNVVKNWGGGFFLKFEPSWRRRLKNFGKKGFVVHLTMYGEPVQEKIKGVKKILEKRVLLVVVGSEKVPREVYDWSDYNISVTNQPHSEISALAVFLHEVFSGKNLSTAFRGARLTIVPSKQGKLVLETCRKTRAKPLREKHK